MNNINKTINTIKKWWMVALQGILFVSIGIWVINSPVSGLLALGTYLGINCLLSGVLSIYFGWINKSSLYYWRWIIAIGVLNVFCGTILSRNPGLTTTLITLYIGIWALIYGVFTLFSSLDQKRSETTNWSSSAFWGVTTVFFGVFILSHPWITGISVMLLIGFVFLATGFFNILLSIKLRSIKHRFKSINE